MSVLERFLRYIKIDSPSDPKSASVPSTRLQLDVAAVLEREMKELGLSGVETKDGTVYGFLPRRPGCENAGAVGFIAHMDTAPEFCGLGVKPQVIENYDGGDVLLAGSGHVLSPRDFPGLSALKGQTLVTTDGTTLLGADDKAGIAEILTALERIISDGTPHGKIAVAFTPDEEIGRGVAKFDVEKFGAPVAYTVDGGPFNEIAYENFNAMSAVAVFTGYSIHPGAAKEKMKNSQYMAREFDSLLPRRERPEHTRGFEGFYHLLSTTGNVEKTTLEYIIRDHDREKIKRKREFMKEAAEFINRKYGEGSCRLEIREQYRNMKEKILPRFELIEYAEKAVRLAGGEPYSEAVRGGTDGASLCYMGLPCPNLGTGGMNAHGRFECVTKENMEKCVAVITGIIKQFAQ